MERMTVDDTGIIIAVDWQTVKDPNEFCNHVAAMMKILIPKYLKVRKPFVADYKAGREAISAEADEKAKAEGQEETE